ncbi:MAG: DMT family transporter [Woeseiaceae bacterium]|nr:DMT family transporter [Woeseiaceae bacterium]
MKMSTADWVMLAALSFLWGLSYFLIEIALEGLPVLVIVSLRIALAAVVLWAFVLFTRAEVPRQASVWTAFLVMGLLNNIAPFTLIVWGQTEITSSLASILNATTPIFAVIVAAVFLSDEPPTRNKIVGVLIGFAGVVVMIGPEAFGQVGDAVLPQLAVVGAALSYAFAGVFGRRFHRLGIKPVVSAAGQVTMSALVMGVFMLATSGFGAVADAGTSALLAVVILAVFCTAVAYILYFRILAAAGATNLMLVTFLIPVTAVLLGVLILDERLQPGELIGMALIAASLVAIDGRLLKLRR